MAGEGDGEPGADHQEEDCDDGNLIGVDRGGVTVARITI
jgi:hypothetical protein